MSSFHFVWCNLDRHFQCNRITCWNHSVDLYSLSWLEQQKWGLRFAVQISESMQPASSNAATETEEAWLETMNHEMFQALRPGTYSVHWTWIDNQVIQQKKTTVHCSGSVHCKEQGGTIYAERTEGIDLELCVKISWICRNAYTSCLDAAKDAGLRSVAWFDGSRWAEELNSKVSGIDHEDKVIQSVLDCVPS